MWFEVYVIHEVYDCLFKQSVPCLNILPGNTFFHYIQFEFHLLKPATDASWNSYTYLHLFILQGGTGKDMVWPLSGPANTKDTESSASSREAHDSWDIQHSWEGQMHFFFGADQGWSGTSPCSPKHLPKLALCTPNEVMPSTSTTNGKRVTE